MTGGTAKAAALKSTPAARKATIELTTGTVLERTWRHSFIATTVTEEASEQSGLLTFVTAL
jgi:hypothetical protein